ncbi:MBL fold metallo-hydrolase [Kribbella sp. NPDC051586]|uniref:MBL fold metallo-hydrolase n=1 Tax=Kribbella sp. NPDC051586 TaxID=3364118 RepID=UPI00379DEF5E
MNHIPDREIAERPEGYQGPNLSPVGLRLLPQELTPGVLALMANLPPKDNNGLIVGEHSALVVDAGITSEVSRQIQELATGRTDRPVRYLVNTTYHGDHTFGNAAFPPEVTVISSRANKANMTDLAFEKKIRAGNMYGDERLLDADQSWRLPDVVFESFAEIDLGGRIVQLWHFGPGNGPGDTIVYVPEARTAWTGNFLCAAGTAHMLLQGGPEPYIESLTAMRKALPDLETIVPGHGPMGDGPESIAWLIEYLRQLRADVTSLHDSGRTVEETIEQCPSPFDDGLDPRLLAGLATYQLPQQTVVDQFLALCHNLHKLNILAVYRLLEARN